MADQQITITLSDAQVAVLQLVTAKFNDGAKIAWDAIEATKPPPEQVVYTPITPEQYLTARIADVFASWIEFETKEKLEINKDVFEKFVTLPQDKQDSIKAAILDDKDSVAITALAADSDNL